MLCLVQREREGERERERETFKSEDGMCAGAVKADGESEQAYL